MIFRRSPNWPSDRLSQVERVWEGRTVVCIATGPSLTPEQILESVGGDTEAGSRPGSPFYVPQK